MTRNTFSCISLPPSPCNPVIRCVSQIRNKSVDSDAGKRRKLPAIALQNMHSVLQDSKDSRNSSVDDYFKFTVSKKK